MDQRQRSSTASEGVWQVRLLFPFVGVSQVTPPGFVAVMPIAQEGDWYVLWVGEATLYEINKPPTGISARKRPS